MPDRKLSEEYESWKKSMTDYQFKYLMELVDKVDRLTHESDALRQENSELKERLAALEQELEKPKLIASGADCSKVLVIDESEQGLTLSDERLGKAIAATGARIVILDPLQAYLGGDVDMHRANEVKSI